MSRWDDEWSSNLFEQVKKMEDENIQIRMDKI